MITQGLVLLSAAVAMATLGGLGYVAARRASGKSRTAALTMFGHGALSTSGAFFLGTLLHVHTVATVHVHSLEKAFRDAFLCDIDWTCAAWIAAFVTATVLTASFVLSQVVARILIVRAMRAGARMERLPAPAHVSVLYVPDPRADAYSVALLRFGGPRILRAEDYVIVTTGLWGLLEPAERAGVLEHELAHVRSRDNRYFPYFYTLASIMFFDPLLRRLRDALGRRYEFEADETAARRTRNPRALALALLKISEVASPIPRVAAFLGHSPGKLLRERIERLIALAARLDAGLE